jgi:predicted ferric reductase
VVGWLPGAQRLTDVIKPYLVYPAFLSTHHIEALPFSLGNPPTIGQALYIAIFVLLNVVLSAVGYENSQPHPWGYNKRNETLAYVGYRTGTIAYGLLPLVVLFSGRNNFLLWLTNWPHSTFILLHRWVARVFVLQGVVHSITLLAAYVGNGIYADNLNQPYWSWGIVATVFSCAMLFISLLWLRRRTYEVFLLVHIVMAVIVIVSCWYHVIKRFGCTWSYEVWLICACCVWFFDRVVRVIRLMKTGRLTAVVTDVGTNHVRIDIDGLIGSAATPGQNVYVYFFTLNRWRPWENHPFSIMPTRLLLAASTANSGTEASSTSSLPQQSEKLAPKVASQSLNSDRRSDASTTPITGVTLLVKKSTGMTSRVTKQDSLLTLIEGPYRKYQLSELQQCDRILLIGGGIGIAGLLAWIVQQPSTSMKLAWSMKSDDSALLREVQPALDRLSEKELNVGSRLDVAVLLSEEQKIGWKRIGVVVCGPGGLCDEVRAQVVRAGRRGSAHFELVVDAFSW